MSYYFILMKIVYLKKTINSQCWWGCGGHSNAHLHLVEESSVSTSVENSMETSLKSNNRAGEVAQKKGVCFAHNTGWTLA